MNLYWVLQDAIDNGEIGSIGSKRLIIERVKRLIYKTCRHSIPEVNDKNNIKIFVYKHPTKTPVWAFYANVLQYLQGRTLVYSSVHWSVGTIIVVLISKNK